RCSNFCPAYNTDKPLSPMHLIHDLRVEAVERGSLREKIRELEKAVAAQPPVHNGHGGNHGPSPLETELAALKKQDEDMPPMVGGRIKEETLWACTTCGACQEVCPVFIDHPEKIIQMRQNLVMLQEAAPPELARTYKNLERQNNPWGIDNGQRMAWAEGLGIKTIEENPNAEYLLWVGCMGAFDDRIKKSTRALCEVLGSAGRVLPGAGEKEDWAAEPPPGTSQQEPRQTTTAGNNAALDDREARKRELE